MQGFSIAKFQRFAQTSPTKLALVLATLTIGSLHWLAPLAIAQAPTTVRQPVSEVASQPAAPQSTAQQESQRMAALILVKNALLAVNQGNLTGNYTVLRDLSSPGFREKNSAADLAAIFQNVRRQKIDLSPIVVMDPVLAEPRIDENGRLNLQGYFVSGQIRINFQLEFLKANTNGWMIHGVSINAVPETATATTPVRR